jgi:site-specific recombinase XerD
LVPQNGPPDWRIGQNLPSLFIRTCCATRCGFKLANDGVDTRALQHYVGHRNINHTVRYTELRSDCFDGFWKD